MPYSSPATVVTGTGITSAWGNSVKAAADFLANPPACRAYHNATQSITNNVTTSLAFNSERYDTAAMHDPVTNNDRITITNAGLYLVTMNIEFAPAADYQHVYGFIVMNAATSLAGQNNGSVIEATVGIGVSITTVYKFIVGDYIQARVYQKNGAAAARNVQASANSSPEFAATWIGTG